MTSVPKPLKFLRPHYAALKEVHAKMEEGDTKKLAADVVSVLAMTSSEEGSRECLQYKLLGSGDAIGSWGHEYVRHLSTEVGNEYEARVEKDAPVDDLVSIAHEIIPFHMKHNAEAEACDLLMVSLREKMKQRKKKMEI